METTTVAHEPTIDATIVNQVETTTQTPPDTDQGHEVAEQCPTDPGHYTGVVAIKRTVAPTETTPATQQGWDDANRAHELASRDAGGIGFRRA